MPTREPTTERALRHQIPNLTLRLFAAMIDGPTPDLVAVNLDRGQRRHPRHLSLIGKWAVVAATTSASGAGRRRGTSLT